MSRAYLPWTSLLLLTALITACGFVPARETAAVSPLALQLMQRARSKLLHEALDGGISDVDVTYLDGRVIGGRDYFNSTPPWSIREIRPGLEAVARGNRNCYKSGRDDWKCQDGGMYLGLPDLGEAKILRSSIGETQCNGVSCKVVGICVSGQPQMGEGVRKRTFWFDEKGDAMHCIIVRMIATSLIPISMEDSEYSGGREVVRAFYRFDLSAPVAPLLLPRQKD